MRSIRVGVLTLAVVVFLLLRSALALGGAELTKAPVDVELDVDTSELDRTGVFKLSFTYRPSAKIERDLALRVAVLHGVRQLFEREFPIAPATRRWKPGTEVIEAHEVTFPVIPGLLPGRDLDIQMAFVDVETRDVVALQDRVPFRSGLVLVGSMNSPDFQAVVNAEQTDQMIARAREFRQAKQFAQAWDVLELGIRMATDDLLKYRFRDELRALGKFPPLPQTHEERRITAERIEEERLRYLRLMAGRFFDRKQFHAAILILEEVGGSLAEQADKEVIGAVNDAGRVQKDADGARDQLLDYLTPDEEAAAKALLAKGDEAAALETAKKWIKEGRFAPARSVLRELRRSFDSAMVAVAFELLPDVERKIIETVPKDQRALAEAEIGHPSFARTEVVASHRFLFIGPKTLVNGIPLESRLHFDLAYVFLTDLFGRVPNPGGDRVTVYFKELWDFGGGVGGGKIIDIGKADPNREGVRVDTGLLYHELTHCIDDTTPVFSGFREGLANVGAAYAFEALAQDGDASHSFDDNLAKFRSDYLDRDLEYWRIPNYGPSAGFFLSFVEKYAKREGRGPAGHDWAPLRQFFREYREAPVRDGREPYIARALAHFLMRAFGDGAFDDLIAYRFPLVEADRAILAQELAAFAGDGLYDFEGEYARFPNSPLPRDLLGRELLELIERQGAAVAERFGRERLGLIYDWKVIGPFSEKGTDVAGGVFPPEYEVDFEKRYEVPNNLANWRDPVDYAPVIREPTGWIRLEYNYQDHTASYGLTHVTVPADMDAVAYARTDDDATLFVNDERIFAYDDRGRNGSSRIRWRGPEREVPDAMRAKIRLHAGRNKVLLRVRNHRGNAGFALSITNPDGSPIAGLTADALPPDQLPTRKEPDWSRVFGQDFSKKKSTGSLDVAVGAFKVQNRALEGTDKDRGVGWRKYTVRPGFPKDSPSNLMWVDEKATKGLQRSVRVSLTPDGACPKMAVTLQGDGGTDGLAGWTVILLPRGDAGVEARVERYDRLVYHRGETPVPDKDPEVLIILHDGRLSVSVGSAVLFREVPVTDIPNASRVGLSTWGPGARIRVLQVFGPK